MLVRRGREVIVSRAGILYSRAAMMRKWAGALALLLGCSADEGPLLLAPEGGPVSGYYRLELAEPGVDPALVTMVAVGSNRALALEVLDAHRLAVMVQGDPVAGTASIVYHGETTVVGGRPFTYTPPRDPRFERLVAFGASLTMGVQNGVPTHLGGLMSPPAQLARQLHGYCPLPLLIEQFLPEMTAADIGPAPACAPPDVAAFATQSAGEVFAVLKHGYQAARVDPDLVPHNVAVGNARIRTMLYGPEENDFAGNFLANLVYDPYRSGAFASQIELLEWLEPTLVISTDLYGNDVAAAMLAGDVIDPSLNTPTEAFEADLNALVPRLAATGAEVFLANMPRPSILPLTQEKKARMIEVAVAEALEQGTDPEAAAAVAEAEADAAIAEVDAQAATFNDLLSAAASEHDNVHVIDLAAAVEAVAVTGIDAGGQKLDARKFGGLLSLDGVHFTDTGYALLANLFIDAINAELATSVPAIDLDVVIATDRGSPAALAAGGFDVDACDR
jgi:lysophospholipase L1-like esterase